MKRRASLADEDEDYVPPSSSASSSSTPKPSTKKSRLPSVSEVKKEEGAAASDPAASSSSTTSISTTTSSRLSHQDPQREAAVKEAYSIRTSEDRIYFSLLDTLHEPRPSISPCALLLDITNNPAADTDVRVQSLQTLTLVLQRLCETINTPSSSTSASTLELLTSLRIAIITASQSLAPSESQHARRQALWSLCEAWDLALALQHARGEGSSSSSSGSGSSSVPSAQAVLAMLEAALGDQDPRVRSEALNCAARLEEAKEVVFPVSFYLRVRTMMSDDHEEVRIAMLHVLAALSRHHKQTLVEALLGESTRPLVDDAFVCICDMVNDLSPVVRTTASRLLGHIQGVSEDYLVQTFDKKLMSHLRRKTSEHEEMRKRYRRVPRADTGNPEGDEDVATMSLMSTGACGAFVHGLEDEFFEVREAAVESIAALSEACVALAEKALDFLVDMFNDDIDSVRVMAIHALTRLARAVTFREEQLELMLCILEDNSEHIRACTHALLGLAQLGNYVCLNVVVQSLFANLRKYPLDYASVWRAMRGLGANHPEFSEFLIESLLRLDFHFAQAEPRVDDHGYIAVLVLVLNACTGNPRIMALLPAFVQRHHAYLHRKYPDLVPHLDFAAVVLPARLASRIPPLPPAATASGGASWASARAPGSSLSLGKVMYAVKGVGEALVGGRMAGVDGVLSGAERDLQQLARFDKAHADSALFFLSYTRWVRKYALVRKVLASSGQISATAVGLGLHLYTLQNRFSGLSPAVLSHLQTLRLHAHVLLTLFRLQTEGGSEETAVDCGVLISTLLGRCEVVARHQAALSIPLDESVNRLKDALLALQDVTQDKLKNALARAIHEFQFFPMILEEPVKRRSCRFVRPDRHDTKARSVFSLLPVAEEVEVVVRTYERRPCRESIRLQVTYPDGSVRSVVPSSVKVLDETDNAALIHAKVLLSANPWTESAPVRMAILYRFELDVEGDDLLDVPFKPACEGDEAAYSLDAALGGLVLAETSIIMAPVAKARNM